MLAFEAERLMAVFERTLAVRAGDIGGGTGGMAKYEEERCCGLMGDVGGLAVSISLIEEPAEEPVDTGEKTPAGRGVDGV